MSFEWIKGKGMSKLSRAARAAALGIAGLGLSLSWLAQNHAEAQSSGLVAAYSFDEGTGTTVSDLSGNGNTGTVHGTSWTMGGKYGGALSFNGTSSYVDLGNAPSLQLTGSMTVSAWINALSPPADDGAIVTKSDTGAGWQLKTSPDTGPHAFAVAVSGARVSRTQRYSTTTRALNTWYHVAGVYNASTKTLSVYVNGVLDNGVLVGAVPTGQVTSSVNVNLGRKGNGYYFSGLIDEVRIYNRALAPSEIQTDMATRLGSGGISDTQAPTAPASLTASATSSSEVNLSWSASTDNSGVTAYKVERCPGTNCTNFVQVAAPTGTGTTYTDTGLAANGSYRYRVRATDSAGNLGGYSPVANATTQAAGGGGTDTQAPTAPAGLTAVATGATRIDLSWNASTDNVGVAGYRVERCQGSGCSNFAEISGTSNPGSTGPLRTSSTNPRYFLDASGNPVLLAGSHTWNNLQDWGTGGSPQPLDFNAYVSFLQAHKHNFTLLWRTEMPKFCRLPTTASSPPDFYTTGQPWQRTGPGNASDGGLKFDLTKFDESFFDRLRSRVQQLNSAGIYTGVYLYSGEWVSAFRCTGDGYPLTASNNINGIDDGGGVGSVTMTNPNAITSVQDLFVNKMVDTLNDMPNVLWIVSEEAPENSEWWNQHQIAHLRAYESGKPYQHPIGWAVMANNNDALLYNSDADWVAPISYISPSSSCGSGTPPCKVNINDSDHSYYNMWHDSAQTNRSYAWSNFLAGNQVVFMDPYVVYYPRENRNLCASPVNGICSAPDSRWNNFRDNLGFIVTYSKKLNLARVSPQSNLSSTGKCLAQTPSAGAEYLLYAPSGGTFTVNLSATSRVLNVEWLNPSTGAVSSGGTVTGGATRSFTTPFSGDAVLYLVDSAGHAGASGPTLTSFSDTTVIANTTYRYRVRAVDAAGNFSSYSNVASAGAAGTDSQAPTAPTALTLTPNGSAIRLSWTASTDNIGIGDYKIERCQGAGCSNFAQTAATSGPGTTFNDSGLAANTSFSYRVRAADAAGNLSSYSNVASASTGGAASTALGAYSFDEGSGTGIVDSSGNGIAGTVVNATWTASGKYQSALSFNGSDSYVDLGNPAILRLTGSATWSAWVKSLANPSDDGQIISKSDNGPGWQLKTTADTGRRTFGVAVSGPSGPRTQRYSNTTPSLNTWYHVAGVYDAAAKKLDIYVNGSLDNGVLVGTISSAQIDSAVNVNIGRRSGGYYFNGLIDEVRIYNRALTQSEIQADMNTPVGR